MLTKCAEFLGGRRKEERGGGESEREKITKARRVLRGCGETGIVDESMCMHWLCCHVLGSSVTAMIGTSAA